MQPRALSRGRERTGGALHCVELALPCYSSCIRPLYPLMHEAIFRASRAVSFSRRSERITVVPLISPKTTDAATSSALTRIARQLLSAPAVYRRNLPAADSANENRRIYLPPPGDVASRDSRTSRTSVPSTRGSGLTRNQCSRPSEYSTFITVQFGRVLACSGRKSRTRTRSAAWNARPPGRTLASDGDFAACRHAGTKTRGRRSRRRGLKCDRAILLPSMSVLHRCLPSWLPPQKRPSGGCVAHVVSLRYYTPPAGMAREKWGGTRDT